MPVQISGDNANVPGQISVTGIPTSLDHVITSRYSGSLKAFVKALNLNAGAPVDLTSFTVPSSDYVPIRCFVYHPTANLASATLGLYTATGGGGGGGTEIVAPTLLASLTGTGKFQELTISALTDSITATTLYPRLTVDSGVAGTAALVLEFMDLSLI